MYNLDFLSGAPRTYIFERNTNKTNLGGIFTLIYLIIVLLIITLYIFEYTKNLKYSVVYSYNEEYLNNDKLERKLKDERYNPEITYKFGMDPSVNKSKFFIRTNQNKSINFDEEHKSKVYDLFVYIGYNCEKLDENNYNCSLGENANLPFYLFYLNYTSYKTEHPHEEFPLQKQYMSEFFYFSDNEQMIIFLQKWKTIKYNDDRKEYYGGVIINDKMIIGDISGGWENFFIGNGKRILCCIKIEYSWVNYVDNYIRTKTTLFNVISGICSLCLTIYNGFIFVYCFFYARKYDNYKIIEKILLKSGRMPLNNKEKKDNLIELSCDSGKKDISSLKKVNDNKDNNPTYKIKKNIIYNYEYEDKKSDEESKILPYSYFYDFIFNNIYCNSCSSKKQEIISLCNNIIIKYYSVDNIVYNQMKLENLFKDYKWNDQSLNTIENNKMINELKSLKI